MRYTYIYISVPFLASIIIMNISVGEANYEVLFFLFTTRDVADPNPYFSWLGHGSAC